MALLQKSARLLMMLTTQLAATPGAHKRAERFAIPTSLRCRTSDESGWKNGTTKNISSSGIPFRCERAIGGKERVMRQTARSSESTTASCQPVTAWYVLASGMEPKDPPVNRDTAEVGFGSLSGRKCRLTGKFATVSQRAELCMFGNDP